MFSKNPIPRHTLEAFHDGALTSVERQKISQQIESNESVRTLYEAVCSERSLVQKALRHKSKSAIREVDWDMFSQRVTDQLTEIQPAQPSRVSCGNVDATKPTQSLWDSMEQWYVWLRRRPGFLLSGVATCGILLVVGLQYMDPGPNPIDDTVVEKIVSSGTTQVAVLQTKEVTGQPITVIVIDDTLDETKAESPQKESKKKAKTNNKRKIKP